MNLSQSDGYRGRPPPGTVLTMKPHPDLGTPAPTSEDPAAGAPTAQPSRWSPLLSRLPGLALALAFAPVATAFGKLAPLVGGPVTGIVFGVALATVLKPGARLRPGIAFSSKTVLQISVVLLGTQLSLRQIVQVGGASLPVMLGSLTVPGRRLR